MEVLVIDYGAGNLTSVMKALRAVGAEPASAAGADAVARASAILIPGVGHFSQTAKIGARARDAIRAAVARGVPLLGICLGLQWLFEGSDEAPAPGLGIFPGRCFPLGSDRGQTGVRPGSDRGQTRVRPGSDRGLTPLKVPHVGWNTVEPNGRPSRLLDAVPPSSFAYFTHTYAAPLIADTVATTTYGAPFSAVLERGSVFAAQFHPEKSADAGLRLLANFIDIAKGAR
jgi:glutamine amidotransferase